MLLDKIVITSDDVTIPLYIVDTAIVGSGTAALNAAVQLKRGGHKDMCIFTEGVGIGTSACAGSDKQTYYRIAATSKDNDNITSMAQTLFDGGSMHGDIALIEAALSNRAFYNLVNLGIPFPHNIFGEYVGYRTDHDKSSRGTTAGPKTSMLMVEKLYGEVKRLNIEVYEDVEIISILTLDKKAIGLLGINKKNITDNNYGMFVVQSDSIVYATGGPAAIYSDTVYPYSQTGSTGIALEAGAKAQNLTEWQYGISSVKFRWNISGSYQQVIPRYISTDADYNNEEEFLNSYFSSKTALYQAIFNKGYEWPFDVNKSCVDGSSLIDLAIYKEKHFRNRKVFIDFTTNPSYYDETFDIADLPETAAEYLMNSGAAYGEMPIDRLKILNSPSIEIFKENEIDLRTEYVEISVCAQHNNGGIIGDIWWQSPSLKSFFPIGEVNGTHGVYRPGGSALNSGQCGGIRAGEYIIKHINKDSCYNESNDDFENKVSSQVLNMRKLIEQLFKNNNNEVAIKNKMASFQKKMDGCAGIIRNYSEIVQFLDEVGNALSNFSKENYITCADEILPALKLRDMLITQFVYLSSIKKYIELGGKSRGSFLVKGAECFDDNTTYMYEHLLECFYNKEDTIVKFDLIKRREIPNSDTWFEQVWVDFKK